MTAPTSTPHPITPTGEATGFLPARNSVGKPITVIGTEAIRATFDETCIRQALNSRGAPGVTDLVLNPDAHCGYGAPVGCVLVSPTHVYPGPVGVDVKCSMSLLQLDVPADAIADRATRRALIDAIGQRTPTGAGRGQRSVKKARPVGFDLGKRVAVEGASRAVCEALGIPFDWTTRCEDFAHVGHDDTRDALAMRLDRHLAGNVVRNFDDKARQLGSYGGGNHFGECEVVSLTDRALSASAPHPEPPTPRLSDASLTSVPKPRIPSIADVFGLRDNHVAFLSHCGSRGFGHTLATHQFRTLQERFAQWSIPLPGGDRELVYAPLGTPEADAYLDDMALGANFATANHLLINALVLEAFQEVLPGATGRLVYFISHNIARREVVDGRPAWVHSKGATRACPAGHASLRDTPFAATGHPILLPGNPAAGSAVMVAEPGAALSRYSVNHGAGRRLGRKAAIRALDQSEIDADLDARDILSNCRTYPKDEAPAAYKDFDEVLRSVELAGLASEVARLKARFVIKDGDKADD